MGGRADAEGVEEGSCLGGKASWGWAAEKGAAEVTRTWFLRVVGLLYFIFYIRNCCSVPHLPSKGIRLYTAKNNGAKDLYSRTCGVCPAHVKRLKTRTA